MTTHPETEPATARADAGGPHPLDPLTAAEIGAVVAILRRDREVDEHWRYAGIELREPDKQVVREHRAGDAVTREALATCWDRREGVAHKAVLSLTTDSVLSWTAVPGVQPNMTVDEWHEAQDMLLAEPEVVAALARRGITDLALVLIDTWTYGQALIPQQFHGRRLGWADVWYRSTPGGNPYANPVNGLHFVLDVNTMELLEIEDGDVVDKPAVMGEYDPDLVPGLELRTDLRPIDVSQPEGPSFILDGNLLTWQHWSLRLGFNYREGLVIHRVCWSDGERLRPIANRLSFAEMVVPYRDPSPDHYRRTAFDIGEWGLGFMTTSLELGCDCLGEIRYLDAVLHDSRGEPRTIRNAICVHEEDDGVLWKHVDERTGAQTRRARRLVVSFHATVANYEYLVHWRFGQDGTIDCEVRATGIMVVSHQSSATAPAWGTLVDERTYAPFHQHFIVARLDMEVDGGDNSVVETSTEALPTGPDNPYGLAIAARSKRLETESGGCRDLDWASQRSWAVVNEHSRNRFGRPVGYSLVPTAAIPAMMDPSSPVFQRAQAIGHTVWVTPFAAEERWPCGEFCNQSGTDEGLPAWTAADRPIADTDVVLWYVFGIHHVTRPEDWPVMPCDAVSFALKPKGFFDRNPALDIPPEPHHSRGDGAGAAHCGHGAS